MDFCDARKIEFRRRFVKPVNGADCDGETIDVRGVDEFERFFGLRKQGGDFVYGDVVFFSADVAELRFNRYAVL